MAELVAGGGRAVKAAALEQLVRFGFIGGNAFAIAVQDAHAMACLRVARVARARAALGVFAAHVRGGR